MKQNVLELKLIAKFDLEHHQTDIVRIKRELRRPVYPVSHNGKAFTLVIRSHETPAELMDRMRPHLPADRFPHAWCQSASADIVSRDGIIDPLVSRIGDAYRDLMERSKPKNVGDSQPRQRWVEGSVKNLKSRTPIQVLRKVGPKNWRDSDKPNDK